MVKFPEIPLRQEKQISSEFHMRMLQELEAHHDEKSLDWSTIPPMAMLQEAERRVVRAKTLMLSGDYVEAQRQLVHAANYETIAWAKIDTMRTDR